MKNVLITGFGQLGHEMATKHLENGDNVTTLSRSTHTSLNTNHHHLSCDLDTQLATCSLPCNIQTLYYFAPPSAESDRDDRLTRFLDKISASDIGHIIYISTSGVYGNNRGEWVTENTAANPSVSRSKRRLDAEQQLKKWQEKTNRALTILRCAAIYSAKTVNSTRICANKKPVIKQEQAPYTNRIHLDDLAEVCWQAMLQPPSGIEIYNVADGHPTTTTEHAFLLAKLAGCDKPATIDISEAEKYYSPAYMEYLNDSRKLDISKLKSQLMPAFKYENSVDGIKACLLSSQDRS